LQFVHLASLEDLHTRKLTCTKTNGYRILLALAEGQVYAVDDMCTHEDTADKIRQVLNNGSALNHFNAAL
jgi:nitrite reductase/ring-hydroxylating ferredoxin subunit